MRISLQRVSGLASPSCLGATPNTLSPASPTTISVSEELTRVLLQDTESYIGSLLFKPSGSTCRDAFSSLSAAVAPSSSRAWATAGYLYLHTILASLWNPVRPSIDRALLEWLLTALRADIASTEEAMQIGAYCTELWIWKVVVGACAVHASASESRLDAGERYCSEKEPGQVEPATASGSTTNVVSPEDHIAWFEEKMRRWARATRIKDWDSVVSVLGKVAWVSPDFYGAVEAQSTWKRSVQVGQDN